MGDRGSSWAYHPATKPSVYGRGVPMIRGVLAFVLATLVACLELLSTADAQQPATPRRVGVLCVSFSPESKEAQQFRQGLVDAGYAEGRDVVVEWRYANGDYARVPE